jgi:hypothetical protein
MTTNAALDIKCLVIEELIRSKVLQGITDMRILIAEVDNLYPPQSEFEMEIFSEAIIYAKLGVLN